MISDLTVFSVQETGNVALTDSNLATICVLAVLSLCIITALLAKSKRNK